MSADALTIAARARAEALRDALRIVRGCMDYQFGCPPELPYLHEGIATAASALARYIERPDTQTDALYDQGYASALDAGRSARLDAGRRAHQACMGACESHACSAAIRALDIAAIVMGGP